MGRPIKIPIPAPGRWWMAPGNWYVDPESLRMTPFGKLGAGSAPGSASATKSIPEIPTTVPDFIYKLVKGGQGVGHLQAGESGQVTITNSAPGPMNISLTGSVPGVEVKLDRTVLKAGENAVLTCGPAIAPSPASSAFRWRRPTRSSPFKSPSSRVRACRTRGRACPAPTSRAPPGCSGMRGW